MVRENISGSGSDDLNDRNGGSSDRNGDTLAPAENGYHHQNGNSSSHGGRRGRRYQSNGRRHHHSSGNDVIMTSPVPPAMAQPASNGTAAVIAAPPPPPPPTQLNIVWQNLPPNYQIAPDQLFVLSGPAMSDDNRDGYVLVAHPVPRGATVLATPAITAPVLPNGGEITIRLRSDNEDDCSCQGEEPGLEESGLEGAQRAASPANPGIGINPNAPPFYPKEPSEPGSQADLEENKENNNINRHLGLVRQPSVMVWNSFFPSGKEFPLRQTQPPVYFHHHQVTETVNGTVMPGEQEGDDEVLADLQ